MNPLCCNASENGLPFSAAAQNDTAFVSGAYQPILNLQVMLLVHLYCLSCTPPWGCNTCAYLQYKGLRF